MDAPLYCSQAFAMEKCGISRTDLRHFIKEGQIRTIKRGVHRQSKLMVRYGDVEKVLLNLQQGRTPPMRAKKLAVIQWSAIPGNNSVAHNAHAEAHQQYIDWRVR